MSNLLSEQIQKGISTELRSLLYFTNKGYLCSIPYGNVGRYDLLVDTGKKIVRIQCKSAHKNDNGSYTVNTSNTAMKANGRLIANLESIISFSLNYPFSINAVRIMFRSSLNKSLSLVLKLPLSNAARGFFIS